MGIALLVSLTLATWLAAAWLQRRSHGARGEVVRNAATAYALRATMLVALLVLGTRDPLPALVAAIGLAVGVGIARRLHAGFVEWVAAAMHGGRAISVQTLLAGRHGDDARLRRLAGAIVIVGIVGMLLVEAVALAAFVGAWLGQHPLLAGAIAAGLTLCAAVPATLEGRAAVLHANQILVGLVYLGLSGATAVLLYGHLSVLTPLPPLGALSTLVVGSISVLLLYRRRSRYVDNPVHAATPRAFWARLSGRLVKIANIVISTTLVLIVALVVMELHAATGSDALRNPTAAFSMGTSLPVIGLVALGLVASCHPLVDVARWQALVALQREIGESSRNAKASRDLVAVDASETAIAWLWISMLGAIAMLAVPSTASPQRIGDLVGRIAAAGSPVSDAALAALAVAGVSIALASMSGLASGVMGTIGEDLSPRSGAAADAAAAWRRARKTTKGLVFATAAITLALHLTVARDPAASRLLAWFLVAASAPLALVPPVVATIVDRRRGAASVGVRAETFAALAGGVGAAVAVVGLHFATGSDAWLWAAPPACLALGSMTLVALRTVSRR